MNVAIKDQAVDRKAENPVPLIVAPKLVKAGEKFVVELTVGTEILNPSSTENHIRSISLHFKPKSGKFSYEVDDLEFIARAESIDASSNGQVMTEAVLMEASIQIAGSGMLLAVVCGNSHGCWNGSQDIRVEA